MQSDGNERLRLDPLSISSSTTVFQIPSRSEKGFDPIEIEISLPYQPYQSQTDIIQLILDGLEKGKNCLIESPTVRRHFFL